ncbi:MAG: class I tRNA ligase family protein, partial [Phycisphaerales bacterium]|nr:class I tRNA ligase family protein [Phycisphaerales bacterium]
DPEPGTLKLLHKTSAGVRRDIEAIAFNTAIAKLIELNNHLATAISKSGSGGGGGMSRGVAEPFVLMLAPFAPHLAEELWARLGHRQSLAYHAFPVADMALAADEVIEIPVQVMGKVRGRVSVPAGATIAEVEAAALAEPKVAEMLAGKAIKKVIVVPGKMVNIVAG